MTGSTPRPGTFTKYDSATGQVAYVGEVNAAGTDADPARRVTTGYDGWGRETTRTTDQGVTVTTAYDAAGRVATVTDPKGVTSYGYDGTDASGKAERRGKPTRLRVSRGGSAGDVSFTAAYDAAGVMTVQKLPGALTQRVEVDEVGQPVGLSYSGQVTPVTESTDPATGSTVYSPGAPVQDRPWLAWSRVRDADGKVVREFTGAGAATDGTPGVSDLSNVAAPRVGSARAYAREFGYDVHGRLTEVRDRTASGVGVGVSDSACAVTSYRFDKNGRRTSRFRGVFDSSCAGTATSSTSNTYAYDSADRATTAGTGSGVYVYDLLGRVTTVPAGDAPDAGRGAISLGYFDDDLPRSVGQGGSRSVFSLTVAGRRDEQTVTGAAGVVTESTRRFYTDGSDNPAWVESDADGAGPAGVMVTRFAKSLAGDLGVSLAVDGSAEVALANPHGDAVTTVELPVGQSESMPAVAVTGWSDYGEYGAPVDPASAQIVGGPGGYGWLGGKQRSTTAATAGLTLMGDRLYDPVTGAFTGPDPELGGNTTRYTYPQDPVGKQDLDGHYSYNYYYEIGQSQYGPEYVMRALRRSFNTHFPIPTLCRTMWVGRTCSLAGSPVRVISWNATAFQLLSLPGHAEGAGKVMWFFMYKSRDGVLRMQVAARGPNSGPADRYVATYRANLAFANRIWQQFANNLRAAFGEFPWARVK